METKYGFETSKQRSKLMSKIKSKNTKPEILLRKAIWNEGIRYRLSNKEIIGNPDIAIKKYKLAIFIDGEFWHGYNWKVKKTKIKSNRDYWIKKIERNIERDKKYNKTLKEAGWNVMRFWEKEITKNLQQCVEKIKTEIQKASV
jgi:DNA mismatch endonuclease (patch repair protein)